MKAFDPRGQQSLWWVKGGLLEQSDQEHHGQSEERSPRAPDGDGDCTVKSHLSTQHTMMTGQVQQALVQLTDR